LYITELIRKEARAMRITVSGEAGLDGNLKEA
jgi:hypothetical protein